MKELDQQDHYQVLEIGRSARIDDIERAYPLVRAAYDEDSLATYSVFSDGEMEEIRERIDLAYRVLTGGESRRIYDASLGVLVDAEPELEPEPAAPLAPAAGEAVSIDSFDQLELEGLDDEEGGDWSGDRLRHARMRRGTEIDQISQVTKINVRYLQALEDEAWSELPAAVYVRGFVASYARAIGLDSQPVATSYMARFEEALGRARRGRMLGR